MALAVIAIVFGLTVVLASPRLAAGWQQLRRRFSPTYPRERLMPEDDDRHWVHGLRWYFFALGVFGIVAGTVFLTRS